ncbi:MAG: branched-chain amino acid ABC transporter permease [Clostridia bacterium]|nr:branched-chain amino acid ABC transporter permease [Clostridia bacterium]
MEFISAIISGLSMGGTYAMIALGYTMVYGIAKMLNFAHGDVIMVGAYMLFVAIVSAKLPVWVGIMIAILVCTIFGIVIERLAYKPLRGASPLAVLITAIGVSFLLQALAQIVFGSEQKNVSALMINGSLKLGEVSIDYSTLVTLAVAAVIMVALTLFVKLTKVGRAMLAVSEDRDAARLMGVDVNFVIMITFIIGSALAGVAGVFKLMKSPAVTPTLGAMPGIKAFTAAVIGGIGSIPGAMVGGVLLGIVEAICLKTPIAAYTDAIEFAILIIILLVKPSGLLGKKRREKV